jgi:hypothetical protein
MVHHRAHKHSQSFRGCRAKSKSGANLFSWIKRDSAKFSEVRLKPQKKLTIHGKKKEAKKWAEKTIAQRQKAKNSARSRVPTPFVVEDQSSVSKWSLLQYRISRWRIVVSSVSLVLTPSLKHNLTWPSIFGACSVCWRKGLIQLLNSKWIERGFGV